MESNEIEIIENISPSVIYQQDKAAIDVQISTAKAYPRNIKRAVENSIAIVTMDAETAETCNYSVPRGGKAITGPSVHLAKILAQQWGNLRIDAKVVGIDATHVTSEAVCFDLENNIAIKTQVKRSIVGKYGRFNEDMITVTGNAANSIALRNAVLSVIPKSVVDKAYKAAKQTITGDISDSTKLIAKRKKVFDGLKDTYSVTEKEILGAIGKVSIDHVTGDDLVVLIGIGTAIKDGDTTIETAFRGAKGTNDTITVESLQLLFDSKKQFLSQDEATNAERILRNKEEKKLSKTQKTTGLKMINNIARRGNFTSSEIVALTTLSRDKKSFGATALTYIEEKNMERRLGRSLDSESNAKPLVWGKLLEGYWFDLLGLEYTLSSTETDVHPTIKCWSGSKDGMKKDTVIDIKSPITLKSFCQLVDPLYEGLTGMDAMNAVRANHKDGHKYYWQLVSNAILNNTRFAELIVGVPYQSEIPAIKLLADGNPNCYWIAMAEESELPFIPDGGYYKNINIIRFEVPEEDKEFLTNQVIKASKMLIDRPSAMLATYQENDKVTIVEEIK